MHAVVVLARNSRGAWIALVVTHSPGTRGRDARVSGKAGSAKVSRSGMLCLVRLDSVVIVNQFFFVLRVQKIFALVEYLRVIFLGTLHLHAGG